MVMKIDGSAVMLTHALIKKNCILQKARHTLSLVHFMPVGKRISLSSNFSKFMNICMLFDESEEKDIYHLSAAEALTIKSKNDFELVLVLKNKEKKS